MHVSCYLVKVVLYYFQNTFQLFHRCQSKELLTEEIGHLVHHQFVKSCVFWAYQLLEKIFDEFALGLAQHVLILARAIVHLFLMLNLELFFVDLVLQKLESGFVFGK